MTVPRLVSLLLCESLHVHWGKHILQKQNNQNITLGFVLKKKKHGFGTPDVSLSFMPVQTCRVEVSQKCYLRTKFWSHSPRNCWNFWDIRSWALPTALRTFPSTEERTKMNTQNLWHLLLWSICMISEASCYSSYGWHTNPVFSAIVRKHGVHTKTCLHQKVQQQPQLRQVFSGLHT